jgi:hypothetical protein
MRPGPLHPAGQRLVSHSRPQTRNLLGDKPTGWHARDLLWFLIGSTHTLELEGTLQGQIVDVTYEIDLDFPG